MKNRFKFAILLAGLSLILGSCYDDKGNYEYHEINDIVIKTSEYTYPIPREGQEYPVTIAPTITQTMTSGTDNLAYEWKRQTGAVGWEVVGHDPTYTLTVTSADSQPIVLRLAVTDLNQDIITYEEITVKPMFKFNQSWFLLQDIDGQAILGCVDGEGTGRDITKDVYQRENQNGAPLSGKPVRLGMHNFLNTTAVKEGKPAYDVILGVFTESQPYILKGSTLENYRFNYWRLLYEKQVTGDLTSNPQLMKGDRNNFVIVDNGKLWYGMPDELALMYPIELSDDLGGGYDYDIAGVGFGKEIQSIVYDQSKRRFLSFNNTNAFTRGYEDRKQIVENPGQYDDLYMDKTNVNRQDKLQAIIKSSSDAFDPENAVPGDFQLDFMGASSKGTRNTVLAVGHSGTNFLVYEFDPNHPEDAGTLCSATWTVPSQGTPSVSEDGKWQVTTSSYYMQKFFYAAGNTIYRVDLTQSVPAVDVIYETDPAYGKIKFLKMKSDNEDIGYEDENSSGGLLSQKGIVQHLGALQEDENGNATLVEIHLTPAGDVELDANKEPVVYTFGDTFQNVVDILFAFRDEI